MKKKIILLFFIIVAVWTLSSNVLADEGENANFSNANFNAIYTNNSVQFYSLEVSNITLPTKSNGKPVEMNIRYTIGNTQPEFSNKYGESYSGTYNEETKKLVFPRLETALQLKGDVYFWIFQLDEVKPGETQTGKLVYNAKVTRPTDKKYSELFGNALIGSTLTTISINTPMENYLTRKAQFKIGEITDNSILSAIKNNDINNGYDKLLKYVENSKTIYNNVLEGKPSFVANLHDDLLGKVKSNTYYYIYTKFDDENGKYYPVEGVTVGLGLAPTTQSCEIVFYGNSKFSWDNFKPDEKPNDPSEKPDKNDDDTNKPNEDNKNEDANKPEDKNLTNNGDSTTAKKPLPATGEINTVVVIISIVLIASAILYYLNKRYNFIK